VNQDEHTQERLAHYSPIPPTQGKYMKSVEQVHLKEIPERPHRLGSYGNRGVRGRYVPEGGGRACQPTAHAVRQAGRAGSWIADLGIVSHETTIKKVGEQVPNSENSRLAFRKLVAQCSILVVIAGIVSWLIAA
jgi:hypothetical protein